MIIGFEIVSDERLGEGGFLRLRRLRLRNVHADGSRSKLYLCDYVERPKGLDAVALVLWKRVETQVLVLIRAGLRPPIQFGRADHAVPLEEPPRSLLNPEIVAGLIEEEDRGEEGIRRRAAQEALEETGYAIDPAEVVLLGAPSMPVPGMCPERHFYCAARIPQDGEPVPMTGDGSPMEEGASSSWLPLEEALAACVRGEIEDSKTELGLRRFQDWLRASSEAQLLEASR